jgi:RNA polymerase sigma-70 factor (ECF subfamily)
MTDTTSPSELAAFAALRPRLFSIAYRMLGIRADAEDVVQDAWLRWNAADQAQLESAEAWLVTVTTRLAIDRLRTRKWPSARPTSAGGCPSRWWNWTNARPKAPPSWRATCRSHSCGCWNDCRRRSAPRSCCARCSTTTMQTSRRCSARPKRRAGRWCTARRNACSRSGRAFDVPMELHRDLLATFMNAAASGDRAAMKALMSDEVQLVADGGGKVNSFLHILHGAGRVAGVYWALEHQNPGQVVYRAALVNGEPGLLRYVDGAIESAQSFIVDDGRIVAVFIMRNPDKLTGCRKIFRSKSCHRRPGTGV